MTNYTSYSYNSEYAPSEAISSSSPQTVISQQGHVPLSIPDNDTVEPVKSPLGPSRSSSYITSMFHSSPYPNAMRRRRTEPIFSFESGPAFGDATQLHELLSMDQTNSYKIQLHAKMDRGFFKADQDWTCYRRNYFQISSSFDIIGMNYSIKGPEAPCLLRQNNQLFQIDYFSIGITARVTNNDKKIELVQHTPKRDKGPQIVPEPRPLRAGGNLHLAPMGPKNNIVTFERLQFKTATANNGKRRAAQQYYEIVVDLYANSPGAHPIRVATCTSAPLVVRGRSPGHYADSHTRFKHMDTLARTPSIKNEKDHPMEYPSPNHHHPSLPNSPLSELGPYSPYSGYSYSPFMPPNSNMYSQSSFPTTTTSAGGPTSYFQSTPPQMYKPNYALGKTELNTNGSQNGYFAHSNMYMNQQQEHPSSRGYS